MSTTIPSSRRLVAGLVAAGLVVGGCASDGAEQDDPPPGQDEATADDLEDGDLEGDEVVIVMGVEVEVRNLAFEPTALTVAVGAMVTWTNLDVVPHTVTSGEPGDPDGTFDEPLAAEATATVTFDEAGTYPYYCDLHHNMTGEVVVE